MPHERSRETSQSRRPDARPWYFLEGKEAAFRFHGGMRGLVVEFPIADCGNLLDVKQGERAVLTVIVRNTDGAVLDEIPVEFDLRLREAFVDYWLF